MYRYTWTIILITSVFYLEMAEARTSHKTLKNHELLTKIGFSRVRAPNNHHRKRLAVESRQHSRTDDSHIFIVKLPPNQHYYVHNRPNSVVEPSKNLAIGFKNNGKPAKIYHWNIPVLKKIAFSKAKTRLNDKLINFKTPDNWNDVLDKPIQEKHHSFRKTSYYVPTKPKKSSFFKYFPGNGKPKSFYVIEKSRKKPHYHRLLP